MIFSPFKKWEGGSMENIYICSLVGRAEEPESAACFWPLGGGAAESIVMHKKDLLKSHTFFFSFN